MKQRSEYKEIDKQDEMYKPATIYLQRAKLAYELLNRKPHSWTPEEDLTQNFIFSDANKPSA